jgi:integrase
MAAPSGSSLVRTRHPGVYKRGARYAYVWRDQDGKQRWGTEGTMDAARREKAKREATHTYSDTVTLHEYANEWIVRYQGRTSRGFRESTRVEYQRDMNNHVLPRMGKRVRLIDIRPRSIADLVGELARAKKDDGTLLLSDRSIRRIIAPLRACLATAVEEGIIGSNPCTNVRLPVRARIEEDEDAKVKALTNDQLAAVLQCSPSQWADLLWFLALTGLRISEALAVRWQDLELNGDRPAVKVRRRYRKGTFEAPKSRYARRDVPLAGTLVERMRARKKAAAPEKPSMLVFASDDGSPMTAEKILRPSVKLAGEEANVPWATFHTLRHTCATRLFADGRNAVQVQRWLGHHSAAFTLATYVHLMDDDLGAPLDAPPLAVADVAVPA